MTIETKFNYGDTVWIMENNKPKTETVFETNIYIKKGNGEVIRYSTANGGGTWLDEHFCFATKEELLKSL